YPAPGRSRHRAESPAVHEPSAFPSRAGERFAPARRPVAPLRVAPRGRLCVRRSHSCGGKAMLWERGRRCTLAPIPHFGGIGEGHSRIAVDIDLVLQEYLLRNHFGRFGPGPYRL